MSEGCIGEDSRSVEFPGTETTYPLGLRRHPWQNQVSGGKVNCPGANEGHPESRAGPWGHGGRAVAVGAAQRRNDRV